MSVVEKQLVSDDRQSPLHWRKTLAETALHKAEHRISDEKTHSALPLVTSVENRRSILSKLRAFRSVATQSCFQRAVCSVSLNSDLNLIATGDLAGNLICLDLASLEKRIEFDRAHTGALSGVAWRPGTQVNDWFHGEDKFCLASCGLDGKIGLWSSKGRVGCLEGHTSRVPRVAFHPTGNYLISASLDCSWKLWDMTRLQSIAEGTHLGGIYNSKFHPDGALLCSTGMEGLASVWDLRSGNQIMNLQGHSGPIYATDFSENGYDLVTAGADGQVIAWDLRNSKDPCVIPAHTSTVSDVKFIKSGSALVTCSYDKTIKVWSAGNWTPCAVFNEPEKVTAVDISGELSCIVTGRFDRCVNLWETSLTNFDNNITQ